MTLRTTKTMMRMTFTLDFFQGDSIMMEIVVCVYDGTLENQYRTRKVMD